MIEAAKRRRHDSQFLALQLKARMEGIPTPVYGLQASQELTRRGHDALEGRHRIRNAALRAHRLAQRSRALSHPGGGGEVESAGEGLSALGLRPSTAAGATPARRKRSAQKNWSSANGVTMEGTPARAAEWEVPEPP
jgi:hypothetical protein